MSESPAVGSRPGGSLEDVRRRKLRIAIISMVAALLYYGLPLAILLARHWDVEGEAADRAFRWLLALPCLQWIALKVIVACVDYIRSERQAVEQAEYHADRVWEAWEEACEEATNDADELEQTALDDPDADPAALEVTESGYWELVRRRFEQKLRDE